MVFKLTKLAKTYLVIIFSAEYLKKKQIARFPVRFNRKSTWKVFEITNFTEHCIYSYLFSAENLGKSPKNVARCTVRPNRKFKFMVFKLTKFAETST
jgi:hypothetical protein